MKNEKNFSHLKTNKLHIIIWSDKTRKDIQMLSNIFRISSETICFLKRTHENLLTNKDILLSSEKNKNKHRKQIKKL